MNLRRKPVKPPINRDDFISRYPFNTTPEMWSQADTMKLISPNIQRDYGFMVGIADRRLELRARRRQDNFRTKLLELIKKADFHNKRKLSEAYPYEVLMVWIWKEGLLPQDYFNS